MRFFICFWSFNNIVFRKLQLITVCGDSRQCRNSASLCYINELRDSSCAAAAVDSFTIFYSSPSKKAAVWECNLCSVVVMKPRDASEDVKNIC